MASFKDVIGNEKLTGQLKAAISQGKLGHAYIFDGAKGSGKKLIADAFAAGILCEKGEGDSCGTCPSCRKAYSKSHPDIIYVTHEKPNLISVDEIREQVNDAVIVKPYSAEKRIFIIDEAEKMNEAAQNALLKTLEEPPAYVVFLLLTSNSEKLLPTIRSRCTLMDVRALPVKMIKDYLMSEAGCDEKKAGVCAAFSQGALGKAIELCKSEDFNEQRDAIVYILKNIKSMGTEELCADLKTLDSYKKSIDDCLDMFTMWYRDVLMYKATTDANRLMFAEQVMDIKNQAAIFSYNGLNEILEGIEKARVRLNANVNFELTMELLLFTIKDQK